MVSPPSHPPIHPTYPYGRRPYQRGGIVTQNKRSKTLAFKPLARAIEEPGEFLLSDFSKVSGGWLGGVVAFSKLAGGGRCIGWVGGLT